MSPFAQAIFLQKYAHTIPGVGLETWDQTADRVAYTVLGAVSAPSTLVARVADAIRARKFLPGGRYLYATGLPLHQVNNCLLLRAEDSREGWADLLRKSTLALMTGAGIGVDYSGVRAAGQRIGRTAGTASGPLALMQAVNEAGRFIRQGGNRRSAIWAGLSWAHPDVEAFITLKDWSHSVQRGKAEDYNFPGPLDGTNISLLLDAAFFAAIRNPLNSQHKHASRVYRLAVEHMLRTGEPGFSVDLPPNQQETLRNACTEVTTADDSDVCNLGSVNLARVESLDEMGQLVSDATAFLLAGTVYSHVPYAEVETVRAKNRRLGLGLMGIHEWLIARGKPYAPDTTLDTYLRVYADTATHAAAHYAAEWGLSVPVKTRAIAPTGTIGIIAETTTGIEPIFSVAYKRSYVDGDRLKYQYVVDPTAKRLIDGGVDPATIEDAMVLAQDPGRRLRFQTWVQQYVDHGISSTLNLPAWGSPANNPTTVDTFAETFLDVLPHLRGMTCYPDGARTGQPLEVCTYAEAIGKEGLVFEAGDICDITKGESCGS